MKVKNAKFETSVANKSNLIKSSIPEIAFVGKSNVGKSSLINSLTNNSKLAKASSTPGRTRLINYFAINDKSLYFVDLPGYGYATASKQTINSWQDLMQAYLTQSQNLKLVVFLVDIRHEPTELDHLMHSYLYSNQIPYLIVATKADKLPKSKVKNAISSLASKLKVARGNIIAFSNQTGLGKEELLSMFDKFIYEGMENWEFATYHLAVTETAH